MKHKQSKKKLISENQKSFFFEDFIEHNNKQKKNVKSNLTEDRFYILFSVFFSLILIFSISILNISTEDTNQRVVNKNKPYSFPLRRDVVDRNGELIARNITAYHAAIKSSQIKNKENFIKNNNKKKKNVKSNLTKDRFYILFSVFFSLILIFSISIFNISTEDTNHRVVKKNKSYSSPLRRDVVDRNGELIARNITAYHAAIKSSQIKNKENFILKIKLSFPDINLTELKTNLENKKYFY